MPSAGGARGLCPLDSRPSPGRRPMRTAPKGAALWTPAGAFAPDPEMLRISTSPAGGTRDLGAVVFVISVLPSLPKVGQAGRLTAMLMEIKNKTDCFPHEIGYSRFSFYRGARPENKRASSWSIESCMNLCFVSLTKGGLGILIINETAIGILTSGEISPVSCA